MENILTSDVIERLDISGPFDPLLVKIMAAIYTGRASRGFMKPSRVYEKILGQPVDGDQATLNLLANLYSVYEMAYGILMMWVHGQHQYRALTMMIEMSAFIHVAFAAVLYSHGAPKEKSYMNLALAFLFGLWYYWCSNSPEGMKDYKITSNYSTGK
ncbi:hypothetical protein BJX63DRAFT_434381 [Aspergillus granulosus]|uniref:Uncharacterized protein n=1 Tax=Aspergillus granulosus TaxID=176169 RepID=A0ABR4H4H1_9EURO